MKRIAIIATIGMWLWCIAFTAECSSAHAKSSCPIGLDCSHPNDGQCFEDEPCFNWAKDGNGARGITILQRNGGSHFAVVGTCRYQKLWYAGKIPYTKIVKGDEVLVNDHVKGDRWARRYGCGFDVQNY